MAKEKSEEEKIKEAKREYHRNYYRKNREKIKDQQKKWRAENPDKVIATNNRYWSKKAKSSVEGVKSV